MQNNHNPNTINIILNKTNISDDLLNIKFLQKDNQNLIFILIYKNYNLLLKLNKENYSMKFEFTDYAKILKSENTTFSLKQQNLFLNKNSIENNILDFEIFQNSFFMLKKEREEILLIKTDLNLKNKEIIQKFSNFDRNNLSDFKFIRTENLYLLLDCLYKFNGDKLINIHNISKYGNLKLTDSSQYIYIYLPNENNLLVYDNSNLNFIKKERIKNIQNINFYENKLLAVDYDFIYQYTDTLKYLNKKSIKSLNRNIMPLLFENICLTDHLTVFFNNKNSSIFYNTMHEINNERYFLLERKYGLEIYSNNHKILILDYAENKILREIQSRNYFLEKNNKKVKLITKKNTYEFDLNEYVEVKFVDGSSELMHNEFSIKIPDILIKKCIKNDTFLYGISDDCFVRIDLKSKEYKKRRLNDILNIYRKNGEIFLERLNEEMNSRRMFWGY